MLAIFVDKITERLKYTFNFVFNNLIITDYQLYDNLDDFKNCEDCKFVYSKQHYDQPSFIYAKSILFKRDIITVTVPTGEIDSVPVIFTHTNADSMLMFDPFAAIFYMISRYEEYLPYEKDVHGRYLHTNSIAHRCNFLKVPIVHIWGEMLQNALSQRFPQLTFKHGSYNFLPTIDVDNAYLHINKGVVRVAGGVIKSLVKLDYNTFIEKILTILRIKKDPYDVFDELIEIQKNKKFKFRFFFLLADYGGYDKSSGVNDISFIRLIKHVRDYCQVGIHPSYASFDDELLLREEIDTLKEIIHCPIKISRQHFLRLDIKYTFNYLYDNGITEDYSLGYAETTGFRAGTCIPYNYFDLKNNETSKLKIYPLSVMDATLVNYMKLDSTASIEEISRIINIIKKYNGTFIPLWHNSSLSNRNEWINKSYIFNEMLKMAEN